MVRGGGLRVGHADRQRAVEILKSAYADGRLDREELEDRAGQALDARTTTDLDALVGDLGIPAWDAEPMAARPAREIPRQPSCRCCR